LWQGPDHKNNRAHPTPPPSYAVACSYSQSKSGAALHMLSVGTRKRGIGLRGGRGRLQASGKESNGAHSLFEQATNLQKWSIINILYIMSYRRKEGLKERINYFYMIHFTQKVKDRKQAIINNEMTANKHFKVAVEN
jgi:hypothetical protein